MEKYDIVTIYVLLGQLGEGYHEFWAEFNFSTVCQDLYISDLFLHSRLIMHISAQTNTRVALMLYIFKLTLIMF